MFINKNENLTVVNGRTGSKGQFVYANASRHMDTQIILKQTLLCKIVLKALNFR